MLTRRHILKATLPLAAGGLFSPFVSRQARAARRIVVASLLGDDKPETQVWRQFAALVEAQMPGGFNFSIAPNAALGGEKDVAEGLRLGSVQASLLTISALSTWVRESQILDLPFLFRDAAHLRTVVDGPVGTRLAERFAAQGFATPSFVDYGARHLIAKEELVSPEQLVGKRMRVLQSPLHVSLWEAFRAVPVSIPIPETYNALSTGVADMMDLTKSAYVGFRLHEVVPVLIETSHIRAAGVLAFSSSFWDGLAPDEQAVFSNAAKQAAAGFDEMIVADESASMALAHREGGRTVQPVDRDAWAAKAKTVWETLAPNLGGMGVIEEISATSD